MSPVESIAYIAVAGAVLVSVLAVLLVSGFLVGRACWRFTVQMLADRLRRRVLRRMQRDLVAAVNKREAARKQELYRQLHVLVRTKHPAPERE